MSPSLITALGFAAAACTTFSFVPQVVRILKTRDVGGISLVMYAIFCTGVLLWTAYGFVIRSGPVIVANGVTLVLSGMVLILTWRQKRRSGPKSPRA